MISVSSQYKEIMARPIRNRAFLSVGIGIIDQNAQASGTANGAFAYWSKGNIFDTNKQNVEYGTLEENYMKADGNMVFLPENDELMQLNRNGITTENALGPIRLDFTEMFDIKGLTISFGSAYPTEFVIETVSKKITYSNNSTQFTTMDVFGSTNYIIITPIAMIGGQQRFRIQNVLMGVGLSYMNEQTKNFSHKDYCSPISDELPSEYTKFTFYDEDNRFNADDDSSFVGYLEELQKVTISFGLELDDGTIEWNQITTNYLKNWESQNGVVSFTATDRLSQMKEKYEKGFVIHERTAYEEAESILQDAGLSPDEYSLDEYLHNVILNNPMPKENHKTCLQLLANACRCIIRQDEYGRIIIRANFANIIDSDNVDVSTNGHTKWSTPSNIIKGSKVVYADLTRNFLKADGKMYFLPEDESYLDAGYVSEQVADVNGKFNKNLLKNTAVSATINGVTFTVNEDGSITANGTATAKASLLVIPKTEKYALNKGFYILSDGVSGSAVDTYYMSMGAYTKSDLKYKKSVIRSYIDNGNFEWLEDDANLYYLAVDIVITVGTTVNNLTFYPMIRLASDTDDTYQPYQKNPTLTIQLPAAYTYQGVNVDFGGNAPSEMIIHVYRYGEFVESVSFNDIKNENFFIHEFKNFDKLILEFTKGYPENHVVVNTVAFGDLTDYRLTELDYMKFPTGYRENKTKKVRVRLFSFTDGEDGEPVMVDNEEYVEKSLGSVGLTKTLQNPLIHTEEHAQLLAEWVGNYYANNVYYTVKYRGEPRINAADIIHAYSDIKKDMQVEVTQNDISFNGKFGGTMEYRRALKMM